MINEKQAIKMSEKGNNTLKFNNFQTIIVCENYCQYLLSSM